MNYAMDFIAALEKSKPTTSVYPEHLDSWNRIFDNLRELLKDVDGEEKASLTVANAPQLAAALIKNLNNPDYSVFKPFIDEKQLFDDGIIVIQIDHPLGALCGLNLALSAFIMNEKWIDGKLAYKETGVIDNAYNKLANDAVKKLRSGLDFSQN